MGSSHPVTPTTNDLEETLERRVTSGQSSLGELSGLEESAPLREEIHSVGTTPVEKGNEVPTPPVEETRSNGVKPMETAAGEIPSVDDSREEQLAAGIAASLAVPEVDSCEGRTLEAALEKSPCEEPPKGSEPETTPTEDSPPELAELALLVDGSSDVKHVPTADLDSLDDDKTQILSPPVLAGHSVGARKRSCSPSPSPRDAPATVEHEAPAMSDESPGRAKRQRLRKDASSSPAQTRGHPAAAAEATTSSPSTAKSQFAIEIEDSADSYEDEGKILSATRIKNAPADGLKYDGHDLDDAPPSLECGSNSFKLPELKESTEPPHDTKAPPKERTPWSAATRYRSSANSFPDYGPLGRSPERAPPQNQRLMKTKPAARGNLQHINKLATNNNHTQGPQSRTTSSKPYDLHGDSYRLPDHNQNKKQKVHGGLAGGDRSSQEIIDRYTHAAGSRGNVETLMVPRVRGGRDQGTNTGLGRENPVQEYNNVEKLMTPRKRGRPGNTGSGDHFDPISDDDADSARDLDKTTTPQVVLKGYSSSSNITKSNTGRPRSSSKGREPRTTESIDSDGSVDVLSAEHYTSNHHDRSKYFPPAGQKDPAQALTINDSSDEENKALEKGNIRPTAFGAPKKPNSKVKKRQERYRVLQILSNTHAWLSEVDPVQWTLIYDIASNLIKFEGEGAPSLTMAVNGIKIIEYSKDGSNIIIRKARDHSHANDSKFNDATNIFLTLGDPSESVALAKRVASNPTIKSIVKKREHLDRVIKHVVQGVEDNSKRQPVKKKPDDVQHSKGKTQAAFDNALQTKQPARGPRIVDQMAGAAVEPRLQPRDAPEPMNTRSSVNQNKSPSIIHDLTTDDDESTTPPERPASSWSVDKPSTSSNSVGYQWTATHPGWEKSWKNSVVYPPQGKYKATVDMKDIERLDEGEYLNDNLIEFYIRWLERHAVQANPGLAKRVFFMNSFFYSRLTTAKPGQRGINYEAVQRWTSKVDLLSYDYIVVPVNESKHWYVAIICNAPKLVPRTGSSDPEIIESSQPQGDGATASSPQASPSTKKGRKKQTTASRDKVDAPRIITLDSLGVRHSPTCTNLREYLVAEIKSKSGIDIPPPGSIGMTATGIPEQDNYSDCGLFMLNYIDKFLERPDDFINGLVLRSVDLITDWPNASDTREKIRDILFNLQKEQIAESGNTKSLKRKRAKDTSDDLSIPSSSQSRSEGSSSPVSSDQSAAKAALPGSAVAQSIEPDVTTPVAPSRKQATRNGISNFESIIEYSRETTEEATTAAGKKPVRERQPTPFPAKMNMNDLDEEVDTPGSRRTSMQVERSEDDEMLLPNKPAITTPARTPSPRLLSDPSLLSPSSIGGPEPQTKINSSPTTRRKPRSPSGVAKKPISISSDAADQAIMGKQAKKRPRE